MSRIQFITSLTKNGVQIRRDPLTNQQTRVNPARAKRPKQGEQSNDDTLQKVIEASRGPGCVFCPENILQKVPKFTDFGTDNERISIGNTMIFPNLNPFGQGHAVGVIAREHYLSPKQFTAAIIGDAIKAAVKYFNLGTKHAATTSWPSLVWNYLPPSAGSILHPHIQMMLEEEPVPIVSQTEELAKKYHEKNGTNYWTDLVRQESNGPRFLHEDEHVQVLVSFAPRGTNEILITMPGSVSLSQLNEEKTRVLAETLSKLLQIYEMTLAVGSFNLVSYSMPIDANTEDYPHFTLHFKLFSRPHPRGLYTSDTGPLERMYDSWVIDSVPEIVQELVKSSWK